MRLVLEPKVKIYIIAGLIFNETEARAIIKRLDLKEPLEYYLLPVKRKVCGKTWTEIL
jgi:hypothetical protein